MNEPRKKFKIVTDKSARVILPNTLTLIGVCIGLTSINLALNQNFKLAIVAIVCAAIIDGLDGRIARLIKGTSKVGKELDSLTDIISFGVAPAFIMYFWTLNSLGKIGWLISLIYVVCVALRLARFIEVNPMHTPINVKVFGNITLALLSVTILNFFLGSFILSFSYQSFSSSCFLIYFYKWFVIFKV